MRKIIFVASPEAASDESLARLDEAIRQIRERAETLFTRLAEDRLAEDRLAEDRLNEYLPPKRDEQAKGKGMTREEIKRLARKAGLAGVTENGFIDYLERFAELVAAAEREACAKQAENMDAAVLAMLNITRQPIAIAAAIRARGEE